MLQQEVQKCAREFGELKRCNNGASGMKWHLNTPDMYASRYTQKVLITQGRITFVATDALHNATLIVNPHFDTKHGTISWTVDTSSTCLTYGYCLSLP